MKLVTFRIEQAFRLGALVPGGVLDLEDAGKRFGTPLPSSMQLLIDEGQHAWDLARSVIEQCPEESVFVDPQIASPLPRPVRLRDANLFLEHLEKSFEKVGWQLSPEFKRRAIYYNADHLHIFGPGEDVPFPRGATWIDYELEWACVIGLTGKNIERQFASKHIFGYCVFNDWSERDSQRAFMTTNIGPSGGKDFANSLGPCIVTPDELSDPYSLEMTAHVNGELWSKGTTGSMYWRFEDAISQFSIDRELVAGEVIGSGTVLEGCGFELDRRLTYGDIVRLEVEGLGTLENKVIAASSL